MREQVIDTLEKFANKSFHADNPEKYKDALEDAADDLMEMFE